MFKKPFKVQGNTKLKKALFKRLRQSVFTSLQGVENLSEEELQLILPSKPEQFEITRLKGSKVAFYTYQNIPVLIDTDGKGTLLPTIFSLWRVPNQILILTVDQGVIPNLLNGAELMAPGLQNKNLADLPDFDINQPVGIALPNSKAFAVGTTLESSRTLKNGGALRGKLVHIEHIIGDNLFLYAWTVSSSPFCSLPPELEEFAQKLSLPPRAASIDPVVDPLADQQVTDQQVANQQVADQEDEASNELPSEPTGEETKSEAPESIENEPQQQQTEPEEESEEEQTPTRVVMPRVSMDEILRSSFLQALKTSLKKEELPINGSVFYSLHIQPNRPRNSKLDLKQTSYKKLNKFLVVMSKEGLITVKTLPKGEIQVVTVNFEHEILKDFETHKTEPSQPDKQSNQTNKKPEEKKSEDTSLKITHLYKPTADMVPVFSLVHEDFKKETLFTRQEAVDTLWSYCSNKELTASGSNQVKLDQALARAIYKKQKTEGDVVTKEELCPRFVSALQDHFDVSRDGVSQLIKGKLEPIISKEERRGGHKSVTRVKGLETFGVSPNNVAKELRKTFAASTTVNNIVGSAKAKGPPMQEVIIQGKMNSQVLEYLVSTYKIPQKYIETHSK